MVLCYTKRKDRKPVRIKLSTSVGSLVFVYSFWYNLIEYIHAGKVRPWQVLHVTALYLHKPSAWHALLGIMWSGATHKKKHPRCPYSTIHVSRPSVDVYQCIPAVFYTEPLRVANLYLMYRLRFQGALYVQYYSGSVPLRICIITFWEVCAIRNVSYKP